MYSILCNIIISLCIAALINGCGHDESSDEMPPATATHSKMSAPATHPLKNLAKEQVPEVIVYGEDKAEPAFEPTPLEHLMEVVRNCETADGLLKALAESPHRENDLAMLCKEAGGEISLLAARALAQLGTPDASVELISLLADLPKSRFKTDILYEASKLKSLESAPILFEALKTIDDTSIQQMCQNALANIADSDILQLIRDEYEAIEDNSSRIALAEILRYIENEKAVPALIELLESAENLSDPLAMAAVDALGTIGSDDAINELTGRLDKETNRVNSEILTRSIKRVKDNPAKDQ